MFQFIFASDYKHGTLLHTVDARELAVLHSLSTQWRHFTKAVDTALDHAYALDNGHGAPEISLVVTRKLRDHASNVISDHIFLEQIGIPVNMVSKKYG